MIFLILSCIIFKIWLYVSYINLFKAINLYYVYLCGVVFVLYRYKEFFLGYLFTRKAILRSVFM